MTQSRLARAALFRAGFAAVGHAADPKPAAVVKKRSATLPGGRK